MTHDELLNKIDNDHEYWSSMRRARWTKIPLISALRVVVELHKPYVPMDEMGDYSVLTYCSSHCVEPDVESNGWFQSTYPCATIQAIEKELL